MKTQTKNLIIIAAIAAIAIITTIAAILLFSGGNEPAENPQTLLDLGEQYLLELDYEQALVQFLRAIEIEPMNARAYIGAAEAYLELGETDKAIAILEQGYERTEDEEIKALLDELTFVPEPEPLVTTTPEPTTSESPALPSSTNEPDTTLLQGEYISVVSEFVRYRYQLVGGIPQPMGISEEYNSNGTISETIMAYMSSRQSENDDWTEWKTAPHYWAGIFCTDCGELPADGSMPEWYRFAFTHPYSGAWKNTPRVFYDE